MEVAEVMLVFTVISTLLQKTNTCGSLIDASNLKEQTLPYKKVNS